MLKRKYTFHFIFLVVFISAIACNNIKPHAETVSPVDADLAYKSINDSILQFPADASLYFRRANRLTQENKHELAYADFKKARILNPALEVALSFSANMEILGMQKERLLLLDTLHMQHPADVQVARLLAEAHTNTGSIHQALRMYDDLLLKDSTDAETYYEKAMLLEQKLNDTAGAIACLQKAYAIRGVDTYGLELAHLYAEQKNPRALEICDFILKTDTDHLLIDPLFIKGIYYANMKQYPQAIGQFDICIQRDWKTTDAYLEKGRAYYHMKNYNAAIQTFNMAVTVSNSDPDTYYWLGRCYESLHKISEALNDYHKALSLDHTFNEARERINRLDSGFAEPDR